MKIRVSSFAAAVLTAACALASAAPPLAGVWNIAAKGNAGSSGELLFRVTTASGEEPVEITVPVIMGAKEDAVARDIRRALDAQLRSDRYKVQLGEGGNVLVSDARGRPGFAVELVDANVDNLRVAVQSVTPSASPTVPPQAAPAEPVDTRPKRPPNNTPGNAVPPPTSAPPPGTITPPDASIPLPSPAPAPSPSMPVPSPPPVPGPSTPVPSPSTSTPEGPPPTAAPANPPAPGSGAPAAAPAAAPGTGS